MLVNEVVAAAIVRDGRVLAARRTHPDDVAGGWELPGGKVDGRETVERALAREIDEELGCQVRFVRSLSGVTDIKPGYQLTAHVVELVAGEPIPHEHDAIRWLGPEDLGDVDWLPSDRPFLGQLREILLDGHRLEGGNVGGALRIGATVRRPRGAWSDVVHDLLGYLRSHGIVEVPQVLGIDARDREVLSYLPGVVVDVNHEVASDELLVDALRWLRRFHDTAADYFAQGGATGWRLPTPGLATSTYNTICHHDFAPYNAAASTSADGDRLVGIFDWDLAGPGRRIDDLAFAGWNWVPLHSPPEPAEAARRLRLLASAYGDLPGHDARTIAVEVVPRIERAANRIAEGQAAGDEGMLNLLAKGEPARMLAVSNRLRDQLPAILAELGR